MDDSLVQVAQVEAEGDEITEQLPPAIRVEDADGGVREAGIADDEDDGVGHQAVEAEEVAEAEACADLVARAKEVDSVEGEDVVHMEEDAAPVADSAAQIFATDAKILPRVNEQEPKANSVVEEPSASLVRPAMSIPRIEVTDDDSGEVSLALDEEVERPPESTEESQGGGDDTAAPLRRYDASFGVPDMVVTAPGPDESETPSEKDAIQAEASADVETSPREEEGFADKKVETESPGSSNRDSQCPDQLVPDASAQTAAEERGGDARQIAEEILVEMDVAPKEVGNVENTQLPEMHEVSSSENMDDKAKDADVNGAVEKSGPEDEVQPHEIIPDTDIPSATQDRQGRRRSSSCSSAETQVALKIALTPHPLILFLQSEVLPCERSCDHLVINLHSMEYMGLKYKQTQDMTNQSELFTDCLPSRAHRTWVTGSRVPRSAAGTSSAT